MAPTTSRELLDGLLEDNDLLPTELDAFIVAVKKEDLFLDYKDGKHTKKPARCRQMIREWVSGFANAEGGVLVLGVSEDEPRRISPCQRVGTEELDVWAQKVLSDMVGFFSPQPRFRVVRHPHGEVLLIAVARAPQLVPCIESRETKYFLRFHDSTREIPAYLISDLVLGRRRHAALTLGLENVRWQWRAFGADGKLNSLRLTGGRDISKTLMRESHPAMMLRLTFVLENSSLVVAEDIELGLIGWSLSMSTSSTISSHVQAYVDAGEAPSWTRGPLRWRLEQVSNRSQGVAVSRLGPFDRLPLQYIDSFLIPELEPAIFQAGVYLMPAGSPPTWFQLAVAAPGQPTPGDDYDEIVTDFSLERLGANRPRLAWTRKPQTS